MTAAKTPVRLADDPTGEFQEQEGLEHTGDRLAARRGKAIHGDRFPGRDEGKDLRLAAPGAGARGGNPSVESTSSAESTGAAPARRSPFGPAERRDTTRNRKHVAPLVEREARRDQSSRALVGLDHDQGLDQPRNHPVALGKVAGERAPGGYSVTRHPCVAISAARPACSGG